MTPGQRRRLMTLINNHVAAQVDLSWIGGTDTEDIPTIESNAKDAKRKLDHYLDVLEQRLELAQSGPPAGLKS